MPQSILDLYLDSSSKQNDFLKWKPQKKRTPSKCMCKQRNKLDKNTPRRGYEKKHLKLCLPLLFSHSNINN